MKRFWRKTRAWLRRYRVHAVLILLGITALSIIPFLSAARPIALATSPVVLAALPAAGDDTSQPSIGPEAAQVEPTRAPKQGRPTRTPRPTATPIPTPPPADPSRTNMMIGFGVLAVIVIVIGVWINRQRTT